MLCIYIENPAPPHHEALVALNSSRAMLNLSTTTSHISIRSASPFSNTSYTLTSSVKKKKCLVSGSLPLSWEREISRTPSLNTQIHLRFRRMRDRVATEFDGGA